MKSVTRCCSFSEEGFQVPANPSHLWCFQVELRGAEPGEWRGGRTGRKRVAVVKGANTLYSGTVSWESPGSLLKWGLFQFLSMHKTPTSQLNSFNKNKPLFFNESMSWRAVLLSQVGLAEVLGYLIGPKQPHSLCTLCQQASSAGAFS